ncbi:MAG: hypothetical protein K8T26_04245 [Lentisphaerae bacterium]|nr:hypothetical protein [Lentisphaerota bacterium]
MKRHGLCVLLVAGVLGARADTVVLKSGASISGEIVGEDAREVRLLVSRTPSGHIQTIKVIDQESVESLQRDTPEVAEEADPVVAGEAGGGKAQATAASTPALSDPAAMREAMKRADALTGGGQFEDAIQTYRAVIEGADAACEGASAEGQPASLEVLQLRDQTYSLLLIALNGRLAHQREVVDTAEDNAKDLVKDLSRVQDERETLIRESKQEEDGMRVRRLGAAHDVPASTTRLRELQERALVLENRLQAQRERADAERAGIINMESEIKVTREKARQAATAYAAAQRASHGRY